MCQLRKRTKLRNCWREKMQRDRMKFRSWRKKFNSSWLKMKTRRKFCQSMKISWRPSFRMSKGWITSLRRQLKATKQRSNSWRLKQQKMLRFTISRRRPISRLSKASKRKSKNSAQKSCPSNNQSQPFNQTSQKHLTLHKTRKQEFESSFSPSHKCKQPSTNCFLHTPPNWNPWKLRIKPSRMNFKPHWKNCAKKLKSWR